MNKNLVLYNSSAGSGKTFTLVKEYLLRILDTQQSFPSYYKHILAITFTNKAAAEMKERVLKALHEFSENKAHKGTTSWFLMQELLASKENGGLGIDQKTLIQRSKLVLHHILHHYNDLSISTIDKFTHKIIRTFAHDLHLPINFDIELKENEVIAKAVDLLISKVGTEEKITRLMLDFTAHKVSEESSWNIERDLLVFAKNLLKENGAYFANKLSELTIDQFYQARNELLGVQKKFENHMHQLANKALAIIKNEQLVNNDFYGKDGVLPNFFVKNLNSDFSDINKTIYGQLYEGKDWYSKAQSDEIKQKIDLIKPQLTEIIQQLIDYKSEHYSNYVVAVEILKNIYALAVINEIEKSIEEIKQENNVLSFSDFNKKIANVIANESIPFIYERLGEKYHHYLIDEFQDTSIIQWFNLIPLVDNSLANSYFNMVVGDAKQSIYRWRGGEVEQIIQFPEIIEQPGIKNEETPTINATFERNFKQINLNVNYRSKAEVVQFNNDFFQNAARFLTDERHAQLYGNLNQQYNADNTGGGIEISFFLTSKEDKKNEDDTSNVQGLNMGRILSLIHRLKKDHYQYSDIAILTRGNAEASKIASFLVENKIDVISSESLLLNNSKEVRLLLGFLHYLIRPLEKSIQLEVMSLLPSGIVNDETIYEMFHHAEKNSDVLNEFLTQNNLAIDVNIVNQYSLYELSEFLMNHFKLTKENDVYLQFFLDKVYEFSAKKSNSIIEFLEWWNDNGNSFSIVVPEGIDAVSLMTIHKSKGLEFPVVIYPFANTTVKPDYKHTFWIEETPSELLPVALLRNVKALLDTPYHYLYTAELQKLTLDLINIMYVGFTRPQDRLYIISDLEKTKNGHINLSGSDSVGKILYDYCANFTPIEQTDTFLKFQFGKFDKNKAKNELKTDKDVVFQKIIHNNWRDKIKVSFQAPKIWEIENPEEIGEFGSSIHSVLSEIIEINDKDKVINKYIQKGVIDADEAKQLHQQLDLILAHPKIAPLFQQVDDVKNETSILLEDGSVFQPDRVVVNQQTVYVLDYKTGVKKNSHVEQLKNYIHIIKTIPAYQKYTFKGYLLYLSNNEIVEI